VETPLSGKREVQRFEFEMDALEIALALWAGDWMGYGPHRAAMLTQRLRPVKVEDGEKRTPLE